MSTQSSNGAAAATTTTAGPTISDGSAVNYRPYPKPGMLKGALVSSPRGGGAVVEVPFQYNPNTLTRTLSPNYYRKGSERFSGPPGQNIDVTAELEASSDGTLANGIGVTAYLAALELMIYPSSSDLETYVQDSKSNKMKAVPPLAARAIFIWGPDRVLPVRVTSVTVTEKQFNSQLTPTLAQVVLKLELYPFFDAEEKDYQLLLTNIKQLEALRAQVPSAGVDIGVTSVSAL